MEAPPDKKPSAGAPAWILTFADLMSLLLAFFVLLFSFSEMDKQKFKELSGSLQNAFGVQKEVPARDTPIGTSIIAREFTPGQTRVTLDDTVRQDSTRNMHRYALAHDLELARSILAVEIEQSQVEVEATEAGFLVVRVKENASFPSASADLAPSFAPTAGKIAEVIKSIPGQVVIAGHSDDLPIHTDNYRSNWDLSSARAVSLLHKLVDTSGQPGSRFRAVGYADFKPIASNDTAEGRARNRRVEVVLLRNVNAQDQ